MKGYSYRAGTTVVALAAVVACASGEQSEEDIGVAELSLLDVPAGVGCIRVTAAGSRVVVKDFNVFTSQHSQFSLDGLPLGKVLFSADAFDSACASIGSQTPSWVGGPVTATLAANAVAPVTIPMRRNGRATVGVDFDDPQCSLEADACVAADDCCTGPNLTPTCEAGACVQTCSVGFGDCNENKAADGCETDVTSDANNCGACGIACAFGCSASACLDSQLTVDGTNFLGRRMTNSVTTSGVTGTLVDGGLCDTTNPAWAGQIVLCQRGVITFSAKGANVEASGGLAAVVYNNVAGMTVGILVDPVPTLPVVGITQADGQFLIANELGSSATLVVF